MVQQVASLTNTDNDVKTLQIDTWPDKNIAGPMPALQIIIAFAMWHKERLIEINVGPKRH